MKHIYLIAGLVAGGLALNAGVALAKGPGFPMGPGTISFESLDTDGNGEISRDEVQAMAQTRFNEADTNADGKLDAAEMVAQANKRTEERVAAMIKNLDKDGDGVLSTEEMPHADRGMKMFDVLDADDSGTVSKEEFAEMRDRMREHHGEKRKSKN